MDVITVPNSPNGTEALESKPRFRILSFEQTVNQPAKEWFVEDVFGPGDVGMLFGDAGVGKTFVAIDLALECIHGGEFANLWKVTRPLSVLYMTDEGLQSFGERLASIAESKSLYDDHDKRYDESTNNFWFIPDMLNLFSGDETNQARIPIGDLTELPSGLEEFVTQVKGLHPNLIIVDTLSNSTTGADENSNRDANIVAKNIKQLIRGFNENCAVLVIHHVAKGTGDYRGASAYKGHCDFMMKLRADTDDDEAAILEFYKAKHTKKPVSRHCLRVKNGHFYYPKLLWSNCDYVPTTKNEDLDKDTIMKCFEITKEWTISALEKETEISRSTLSRRLSALRSDGQLMKRLKNPNKNPGGRNHWIYSKS